VVDGRVAIVGAGIAGLTAAAALGRAGMRCTVFERAEQLNDAGGGVQVSPNGTRLLHRLGLADALAAVAVRPRAIEMRRWRTGRLLGRTTLGRAVDARYGAPYYALHRAHLHGALLRLVASADPDQIRLGHRCVAVTETTGAVELAFANGSVQTADLVIGADGINSVVRRAIAPEPAQFSGLTVYRGLVPADRVPHLRAPRVVIWPGPGQHFVCYPVASGHLVNFVATAPVPDRYAAPATWSGTSWVSPADAADLVAGYAGWHTSVRRLLDAADFVTRWRLPYLPPLNRWHTDRVAVIGDAAHPMLPFGAQGANQAIEDAIALAACLRGGSDRRGVADRSACLRRYGQMRQSRVDRVAALARDNLADLHLPDGARQRERDASMHTRRDLAAHDWIFGHDAEAAALATAEPGRRHV
jgi:salicylate hydroxylase